MAGREVREYTNLSDPKDKKWGKGKDKLDDEDVAFQRMVAKMQEVAGERGGYLHGRGALDSDDLLYLKEQMEAEEDAERLLRRTEKRAFAAFKISFIFATLICFFHFVATIQHSSPALSPLPLRVEPKPKSGIRQQDLLKKVVEVKPKRPKFSSPSDRSQSNLHPSGSVLANSRESNQENKNKHTILESNKAEKQNKVENPAKSLLGLAYASSDDED
ncbi:Ankyrin repeat domain-containing protein 50 isoform 1 [Theobroma cacao]|uniref:Ankyrin repeat domain-containing protein 50 isoform 1 n=1 Tax=Theobroma cacao TaxID=3641 RepID=A0A061FXQ9_THECC|nr:Ankyrin repeat domain-containing protein 50 isoform 1 [Theobroma cacao]